MFKIISITRVTELMLMVWVEEEKNYQAYVMTPAFTSKHGLPVEKRQYRDYEHFVWVMGKFNPSTRFLEKTESVDKLTFGQVIQVAEKLQIRLDSY